MLFKPYVDINIYLITVKRHSKLRKRDESANAELGLRDDYEEASVNIKM